MMGRRSRALGTRVLAAALATLGAAAALVFLPGAQPTGWPGGGHQGLALWLRADVGIVADGGNVVEWRDQSGNERHATQLDPAFQPVVATLRGTPAVLFKRGACLGFDGEFLADSDYTVVVVDARRVSSPLNLYVGGDSLLAGRNLVLGYLDAEMLQMTDLFAALDGPIEAPPVETVVWSAFVLDSEVGRRVLWKGAEVASDDLRSQLAAFTGATIGRVPAYEGQYYSGYIAEVMIYTRALSNLDLGVMGDYISAKYASVLLAEEPGPAPPLCGRPAEPAVTSTDIWPCQGPTDNWATLRGPYVEGAGEMSRAKYELYVSADGGAWELLDTDIADTPGVTSFAVGHTTAPCPGLCRYKLRVVSRCGAAGPWSDVYGPLMCP